jgi:ATP-dependent exoDNAse (exonuclease V) beta subunit
MPQVSLVEKEKVSKTVSHLKDKNDTYIMNLGTKVHEVMESLDFKNPKIDSLNLTNDIKDIVNNVLSNPLFSNIKDANTYHELEFSFDSNNIHYDGIIDLLAVYNDHVDIIDYKLSNVDSPEYKRQLSIYKEYVRTKTNLRIDCYLLSLTKNLAKKVEC